MQPVSTGHSPATTNNPEQVQSGASCGADKLGAWIGQTFSNDALAEIKSIIGHDRIRVIRPDSAVTMDYRPDRLNIDLDSSGKIIKLHCV